MNPKVRVSGFRVLGVRVDLNAQRSPLVAKALFFGWVEGWRPSFMAPRWAFEVSPPCAKGVLTPKP